MNKQLDHSPFLKACRKEPTHYTPIWLLRQAGRYMKEYRDLRKKVGFIDLCTTPELSCETTITAVEKIGADAAIIFSDILLITQAMGFHLNFVEDQGPIIANPFLSLGNLYNFPHTPSLDSLNCVLEAISLTRKNLPSHIPLIGFAGAPFTIASYVLEGKSPKKFERTKQLMHSQPEVWEQLMTYITVSTAQYLELQVSFGVNALQIFDSWIGILSQTEYQTFVLPHMKKLFLFLAQHMPHDFPLIHFGTNTAHLMNEMKTAGGNVLAIDYRINLKTSWEKLGNVAVQGNLDPAILLCSPKIIEQEAKKILDQADKKPGHIFNVSGGILPSTPVEHVKLLIDFVHDYTQSQ